VDEPKWGPTVVRTDEKSIQQAYVDWVYRLLKLKISDVEEMRSESAALNGFWENKKRRLESLRAAQADGSLVIGCLDMLDGDAWYIGKASVDGQGDQELALMDWRADFAKLFYQADRSQPGGVGRRLTFTMSQRLVKALSEDVLTAGFKLPETELAVAPPPVDAPTRTRLPRSLRKAKPEPTQSSPAPTDDAVDAEDGLELRARDLLLDELDRERTGRMQEIISTIQADQDRLIRRASERVTVVQGGPGTGKTVVGLHRAAWVLYQQRNRRLGPQDALVVGPNRAFVDYIDAVLPQLGERTAAHLTLAEVAVLDLPDTERARLAKVGVADERLQRIKGDLRMVGFVREAVWGHAAPAVLSLRFGHSNLSLTRSQVAKIVDGYRKADMSYDAARQRLASDVLGALFAGVPAGVAPPRSRRADPFQEFSAAAAENIGFQKWVGALLPAVVPRLAIQRALTDPEFFGRVAKRHLTPTQRGVLGPPRKVSRMAWTESDLPLIAEADRVITGVSRRFGHVVVDEAQDLSPMQWRLVARRASSQSMTILGDLAQATSVWAPKSWMDALALAGLAESATVAELEVGYRVPQEIMALASRLLPEIAPAVSIPQSVRSGAAPLAHKARSARALTSVVASLVAQAPVGSVGVIAADIQVEPILRALLRIGLDAGRGSSDGLSHRVTVLDSSTSKGLEFDHVVVVEPSAIAGRSAREKRRLFVALTRATKTLTIVHANLLPVALRGAVPDHEIEAEVPAPTPRPRASKTTKKAGPATPAMRRAERQPLAKVAASAAAAATARPVAVTEPALPADPEPRKGASKMDRRETPVRVEVRTKGLRKVAVRSSPSEDSPELGRVRGPMALTQTSGEWGKVRTPEGVEGWVLTRDLRF